MLAANAEAYAQRLDEIAKTGDAGESLRAIEQLTSRVLGKPKETVETTELPADLAQLQDMTIDELNELWRRLDAEE